MNSFLIDCKALSLQRFSDVGKASDDNGRDQITLYNISKDD